MSYGEFIGAFGVMMGGLWPIALTVCIIGVCIAPFYFAVKSFDRRLRAHVSMKKINPIEVLELEIADLDKELEKLRQ